MMMQDMQDNAALIGAEKVTGERHVTLKEFINRLASGMEVAESRLQRELTQRKRVDRRFSLREVGELFGVSEKYMGAVAQMPETEQTFPAPEIVSGSGGRTYALQDLLLMRAHLQTQQYRKRPYLYWRQPGDPLRIVTFGAQKGGTGKSLSASHFAQYLTLNYGLRVGVIDCDPQATATLYFADADSEIHTDEAYTVAHFMGVDDPSSLEDIERPVEEMDAMWQKSQWPGLRFIPGGGDIPYGDVSLFLLSKKGVVVPTILRDAIRRWDEAYGPHTTYADLRREDGSFDTDRYQVALTETVDVIIIDQQPSLSFMQLNGLVAATSLIVPQTMKSFDLSTLSSYADNIREYLDLMPFDEEKPLGRHAVLPTIVQEANDRDVRQIADLWSREPDLFTQVWYSRSDAVANAADEFKSIYEYDAPRERRASARSFMKTANAVNDALVDLAWNGALPTKGHAQKFIEEKW